MNQVLDKEDRSRALDAFAARPSEESTSIVPAQVFASPAERVFGAQPVAVKRDEGEILKKLKTMAAAAGDDWYYRFPVRKKVKDEATGKEEWVTDYIEGPSIKCANNVSRLYGNCDIDTRVIDLGSHYLFYARFMDLETGYSLVRPFQQRKSQKAMKTDAGRQEDIIFQIGASKAIRNVISNALEFFTNYAWNEAKNSIIETVGQKLEFYRSRVVTRLAEMKIDIKRVELVRGRAAKDWLAADIAMTIAEIQAINDGMATIDETYLPFDPETGEIKDSTASTEAGAGTAAGQAGTTQETGQGPDKAGSAATNPAAAGAGHPSGDAAGHQPATGADSPAANSTASPQTTANPNPAGSASGAAAPDSNPPKEGAGAAKATTAKDPTNEAEYIAHSDGWIGELKDADAGEKRWKDEKGMRNKAHVGPDAREAQQEKLSAKCKTLRGGK